MDWFVLKVKSRSAVTERSERRDVTCSTSVMAFIRCTCILGRRVDTVWRLHMTTNTCQVNYSLSWMHRHVYENSFDIKPKIIEMEFEYLFIVHVIGYFIYTGSPFKIPVGEPPDPRKVRVYGPGVQDGLIQTFESKFLVETSGAGAGQLAVRIRGPRSKLKIKSFL